ncbi:putative mitochondrial protein [Cucumis melo var. makuwa]|uniref:Mitochondrial protein n=1 Tax=Cucumis melo var. makuwa TaxID=1194695 RepID=A0A5A7SKP1_CUCMM|nr:putative mitochondrial protein [Cucumis melo var. makuwa]TYK21470.1 putative mitochondrial protein [Cucumis melo var. makuwa]
MHVSSPTVIRMESLVKVGWLKFKKTGEESDVNQNSLPNHEDASSSVCQTPYKEVESTKSDPLKLQSYPSAHVLKNHPSNNIIGGLNSGVTIRKKNILAYAKMIVDVCFTSNIEPTNLSEALKDEQWVKAMQEGYSNLNITESRNSLRPTHQMLM